MTFPLMPLPFYSAGGGVTLTYVGTGTYSSPGGSFNLWGSIQEGDILVAQVGGRFVFSTAAELKPSGWTTIDWKGWDEGFSDNSISLSYKVASSSDSGAAISSSSNWATVYISIYRPDVPVTSVSLGGTVDWRRTSNANPPAQTAYASNSSVTTLVFGGGFSEVDMSASRSFSPTGPTVDYNFGRIIADNGYTSRMVSAHQVPPASDFTIDFGDNNKIEYTYAFYLEVS